MANIVLTPTILAREFLVLLVSKVGDGLPDDGILSPSDAQLNVTLKVDPNDLKEPINQFDARLAPLVSEMAKVIGETGRPLGRKLMIPSGTSAVSETYRDVCIRVVPGWSADYPDSVLYRFDTFVRKN